MNAVLSVNDDLFVVSVFGEPATLAPALHGVVTDDYGHGRSFDSPAHLAHEVVNGLVGRGYRPRPVEDFISVDYEYELGVAPNGQALLRLYNSEGLLFNGRVKDLRYAAV